MLSNKLNVCPVLTFFLRPALLLQSLSAGGLISQNKFCEEITTVLHLFLIAVRRAQYRRHCQATYHQCLPGREWLQFRTSMSSYIILLLTQLLAWRPSSWRKAIVFLCTTRSLFLARTTSSSHRHLSCHQCSTVHNRNSMMIKYRPYSYMLAVRAGGLLIIINSYWLRDSVMRFMYISPLHIVYRVPVAEW